MPSFYEFFCGGGMARAEALQALGYRFGARTIGAADFLPQRTNLRLIDCLDADADEPHWHSVLQTERLLATLSPASRRDVALTGESEERAVGALFRRTRPDGAGGVRVQAEARFDGLAGCLRTQGGSSSRQFLTGVTGDKTRTRMMTPREAARLMGLPDAYALPSRATDAFHLLGDGVATPAVRFLSENLLLPLVSDRLESGPALRAKSA
jgi:DNA (cytosine-5)-methyltransferase 1